MTPERRDGIEALLAWLAMFVAWIAFLVVLSLLGLFHDGGAP